MWDGMLARGAAPRGRRFGRAVARWVQKLRKDFFAEFCLCGAEDLLTEFCGKRWSGHTRESGAIGRGDTQLPCRFESPPPIIFTVFSIMI